jgi:DNA-binding NarL/FixJ family response regulator
VDEFKPSPPRILILEPDRKTCAMLRGSAVKGWRGAAVRAKRQSLEEAAADMDGLKSFDVLLAGCDFTRDGTSANPTLRALRAMTADPHCPPIVLLTYGGSEYTAVQAMQAGAADCLSRSLLGKEQIIAAVQNAVPQRKPAEISSGAGAALRLFGYDVRRCLAEHDNVSVHAAFSAERNCEVVVKVLRRGRGSLARDENFESLVEEFKLLYDIDDPAVARIYDFRVTAQYCYIAMEYFPDGHLGRLLHAPLDPLQARAITVEIAHSLSIIHAAGIVHRDLKPGNIMRRADGSCALIDFGISQSSWRAGASGHSRKQRITGTPYYMSPEQARGETTDERTDLYSLGVILYQMLTGEKPYVGPDTRSILDQHCDAPLPRLPAHAAAFQPLLDRLLAKEADQRPSSARALIETIERVDCAAPEAGYVLSGASL